MSLIPEERETIGASMSAVDLGRRHDGRVRKAADYLWGDPAITGIVVFSARPHSSAVGAPPRRYLLSRQEFHILFSLDDLHFTECGTVGNLLFDKPLSALDRSSATAMVVLRFHD